MIEFLKNLWPAPRPHRQEYRNTIQSVHLVKMARKWKTAEQEVTSAELRELERQSA